MPHLQLDTRHQVRCLSCTLYFSIFFLSSIFSLYCNFVFPHPKQKPKKISYFGLFRLLLCCVGLALRYAMLCLWGFPSPFFILSFHDMVLTFYNSTCRARPDVQSQSAYAAGGGHHVLPGPGGPPGGVPQYK